MQSWKVSGMRRKVFSIRIDPQVWKAAREKGLNISQICEQTLKIAVSQKGGGGTVGSPWWAGPD